MKLNESTGELLARITNNMVIIKGSCTTYENKVEVLAHHDAYWGNLATAATKWRNNSINNMMQFFKMQLFSGQHCQATTAKLLRSMTRTL